MRIPSFSAMIAALALPVAADTYWPSESDVVTATSTGLSIVTEDGRPAADIPFGTGFQDTIHGLIGILGWDVEVSFPQECGAGPMVSARFTNDITLMFADDHFAGWFLGDGDLMVTDTGLWHGAPIDNLTAAGPVEFFESGLGTEFGRGDLYGLLTEDRARIEALWTGANCIFR